MYTAQLHTTFDQVPLTNAVSGTLLTMTGGTPELVAGPYGNAWQMQPTKYAEINAVSLSSAFTIAFWLKPRSPGFVANPTTGASEPLLMPLLSKATFSYNSTTKTMSATQKQFIIWEESVGDNKNTMNIKLSGATTAVFTSTAYDADVWHYFYINYTGGFVGIICDFISIGSLLSGTSPPTLSGSGALFGINVGVEGSSYQIARNTGVIDDLVVFNSLQNASDMARVATLGAIYVADNTYTTTEEINIGLIHDDSSTVQVNSVSSSRGNLFVARSDGKLLRGVKSLWQSRHIFGTEREMDQLDFFTKLGSELELSNGSLRIKDEIVKL